MTSLEIIVPVRKANWLTSNTDRIHWGEIYRRKSVLRQQGYYHALAVLRAAGLASEHPVWSAERPCRVEVAVGMPTRRRFDPANASPAAKAVLDGFTDAGVWSDDNAKVVRSVIFTMQDDLSEPGTHRLRFLITGERTNE